VEAHPKRTLWSSGFKVRPGALLGQVEDLIDGQICGIRLSRKKIAVGGRICNSGGGDETEDMFQLFKEVLVRYHAICMLVY